MPRPPRGRETTVLGLTTNIRRNARFAYEPELSYSVGAQYDCRISAGVLTMRSDYGWQSREVATLDIKTGSLIPAYGLLNARLAFRPSAGRWRVALFGSNLTGRFYRINGFFIPADQIDNGTVGRPREWGLTVDFRLD